MPGVIHQRAVARHEIVRALLDTGCTTGAASLLGVHRGTLRRSMISYGLYMPRQERGRTGCGVRTMAEWQGLWRQHDGNVRAIVRATGLNRTYIRRELDRYGIRDGDMDERSVA